MAEDDSDLSHLEPVILRLKPGDLLALCINRSITLEEGRRIERYLNPLLESVGAKGMVFGERVDFTVIRPEQD